MDLPSFVGDTKRSPSSAVYSVTALVPLTHKKRRAKNLFALIRLPKKTYPEIKKMYVLSDFGKTWDP